MEVAQIQTLPDVVNVLKVLATGIIAFMIAFAITPLWTKFLYTHNLGKRPKELATTGEKLVYFDKLHQSKVGTPGMGGVIVWLSVLILIFASHYLFPFVAQWVDSNFIARLDFLNRKQTWLLIFVLVAGGILGLLDDYMSARGWGKNKGKGMRFAMRFWWLFLIAGLGAWWFYEKLGWDQIHVPALGDFSIGLWYIPVFIFVILFTAISSNETDGLDGLNGGVLLMAFGAFSFIAFMENKMDIAAFCAAVSGALLAFLWFNVYPARFFMGDTGALSLGLTLGVIAMLTNSVLILFIIVFIYILESASVVIQLTSKRFFGKKVFLAAPIHHHFEALGWPEPKVTMRIWIFTILTTVIGLIVATFGRGG